MKPGKVTLLDLAAKKGKEKIVMVTAYDAPGARLAEQAGIDILLVGDTAGMVVLGHEGTVPVTMDEMLFLTRSVVGAVERPLVVGDMPFGSYHVSDEDAIRNAIRFVKEAGADVVKLEGAGPSLSRVKAIVSAGIGVMGHVGLTPQSETILGGFKTQGRTAAKARQLLADALALEASGCFAIVLEAVPVQVAARITEALTVPTIGIGAGPDCDGQVLVYHDLLGLTEGRAPRFVKRYANLAGEIRGALETYASEVRSGVYPAPEHTYGMPDEELELFSGAFLASDQRIDRSVPTDAQAEPAHPEGGTASGASADRVEHGHDSR
jgi:3-methyl-2-oxobutanoate hydroxymethyltransferase